jgi:hypothetical protein
MQLKHRNYNSLTESHTHEAFQLQADFLFFFYNKPSVAIFHQKLRTELVAPFVFKVTPLGGPHGKYHLPLLWMHVYSCVAGNRLPTAPCASLAQTAQKTQFPFYCLLVYKAVAW